ncbi:MAG: hypothetical protein GY832_01515 [Chloroflexi bacterium]|nr:hypothetical protein [Chloroflexota bacterium]
MIKKATATEAQAGIPPEVAVEDNPVEAVEAAETAECLETPYSKAEHQHYDKIRMMEIHVSTLEGKWKSLKEETSDAKKAFEGAESELRATIRKGAGQMELPGMEGGNLPAKARECDPEFEEIQNPTATSDTWQLRSMADVGITPAQVELFADAKILNLGDFAKLGQKAGVDWYKQIKGIGKGKADKIDLLLMQFRADNPQYGDDREEATEETNEDGNPPEAEGEKSNPDFDQDSDGFDPDFDDEDDDDLFDEDDQDLDDDLDEDDYDEDDPALDD